MADREQPYDPYIPSGQSAPAAHATQNGGNQRTAALQAVCPSVPCDIATSEISILDGPARFLVVERAWQSAILCQQNLDGFNGFGE